MTDNAVQQRPASPEAEQAGPAQQGLSGVGRAQSGWARRIGGQLGTQAFRLQPVALSPARAVVVAMLGGLAAFAFWYVAYAVAFSGLQEHHSQHLVYTQLRSELAAITVPIGGVIAPGTPVADIDASSIGLHSVVVEGTSSADLAKGPGHLPDTPIPGQAGNSQIYGRSTMFGAPFGTVHDLRPGSIITVTTGQAVLKFRVLDVRGPGDPLPTAAQIGKASLTLVTSGGTGWTGHWTDDHVIYADATLVTGKIQSTPRGRPTAVPSIDNPLAGDTGQLVPVVLWLQVLVLVCIGLAFAYTRWAAWQVWIVGLPTVLAVLWATTSAAILLLPNLT